jgi:hypothetical protein
MPHDGDKFEEDRGVFDGMTCVGVGIGEVRISNIFLSIGEM